MTTRLAVGIAAVLAALVFIPVAAVVALGAYGSSLGGRVVTTGSGGAELVIFPAHGLPGSPLKVTGNRWPPRTGVAIGLQRRWSGGDSELVPLRLAEIITSRRGTFELNTTIPASIIPIGTSTVHIQASGLQTATGDSTPLSAPFKIDPYPNELIVGVVDASSGLASAGAIVRIDDSFGQEVALEPTGPAGEFSFAGIRPGKMQVTVRQVDYEIATRPVDIPETGQAALLIALRKSAGKRLLFFTYESGNDGETLVVGLDRASGLPILESIAVPNGRLAPDSGPESNLYQGFFLSVDQDPRSIGAGAGDINALWAIGAAGRELRYTSSGYTTALFHSYLGRSTMGDVVFSRWSAQLPATSSRLSIVDPESGQIVLREDIALTMLAPVLSSGGSSIYLVNWATSSVDRMDLGTGEKTTIVENLPFQIAEAVGNPSDDSILILSATDGSVYKLHTQTGKATALYQGGRIQSAVGVEADGRLMTSDFRSRELVVSSLQTGQIHRIIPLQSHVDWILADRSGPFIFAATVTWPGDITVQAIDSRTSTVAYVTEVPRPEYLVIEDNSQSK